MPNLVHLHVHTQYSILDGLSDIKKLVSRAKELEMPAVAITDHGNMYGVVDFYNAAKKEKIKPIIGCEAYVVEGSRFEKGSANSERTRGFHCVLLAKNKIGYINLCKLISLGFKEGFYYNSRVDRELLERYSEGLICSSACLAGEIPYYIWNDNMEKAEAALQWYKKVFKDDFYLELMSHGLEKQRKVNDTLRILSKKYDVKLIVTNDVHYIRQEDRTAHDILICINTNSDYDDEKRLRYSGEEYFKTYNEMLELFPEDAEALANTLEIADKVEEYSILKDNVIVPVFDIPEGYEDENAYLRKLTYDGAERKYGEITDDIRKRLDYELSVIERMGFPGYFLIVQDYINHSRNHGVIVGPGRGSAAGSAVAYAIGITNVDPIKYHLLFERFLNPERVSMPDIDVDFDDAGREKVLEYVVKKYGDDHVAQIVTFGTMASKMALRDVGRVFKLPIPVVDRICKKVPDKVKDIGQAIKDSPDFAAEYNSGDEDVKRTIDYAIQLEGVVRQTGVHACGVIIGPEDLTNHVPLASAKDSDILVTQIEGSKVESAGMLKMDFLGLKTLSIMKDAIDNIKNRSGEEIDIDNIPLDDELTYKLFQEGGTIGVFQFESPGMQKYLKELMPENIEDLIAMNALYRPGPMDFIPLFIDRKRGRKPVEYPHSCLEGILKATYGIMVYQEQIMQTAQACAGFSLGKADILRRAMGKKKMDVMMSMKKEFVEGSVNNGIEQKNAEDIFDIMVRFAEYGFNRSHAAAYSVIAYQTAYLKAHYPAEFMAAVLTHNLNDIKKISFFIEECRRLNISVRGPNVNESYYNFGVNQSGQIVYGLAGIKGVGMAVVQEITEERKKAGQFKDIVDFLMRVSINRKALEALASVGAFDSFPNIHRAQFFFKEKETSPPFAESLIKTVNDIKSKKNSAQFSLFGDIEQDETIDLKYPVCQEFNMLEKLKLEKEGMGFYISGYPLDQYKLEIDTYCNCNISAVKQSIEEEQTIADLKIACMLISMNESVSKTGNPYCSFVIEDSESNMSLMLFSEAYMRLRHLLAVGSLLVVSGSIINKYGNKYEFRVNDISLLDNLMDRNAKQITIQLDIEDIDKSSVDQLNELIDKNPGKCGLNIHVVDNEDKRDVKLKRKGSGVLASAFIQELKKHDYNFKLK